MITPRPYQISAENSIIEYFQTHSTGNPVIAMPTGTGKAVVQASFLRNIFATWPQTRVICATHVKELLQQNSNKLVEFWPDAPYGIYSAGLKSKQTIWPIIFAGVASMVKRIDDFGHRDLFIIDEAHLLNPSADTMYQKIITRLTEINPAMRVIGLTATPYRMGQGLLVNDGMFTHIAYDITGMEAFNKLIADGYLSPLISKRMATQLDISHVGISKGDFNQSELEAAIDTSTTNYAACKEIIQYGYDRNSWLVFASGIKHAEHIAEILKSFGVTAEAIHSKLEDEKRDSIIAGFRSGSVRCIVNNNVLTTGFDFPPLDFISVLRPTMSTGLWIQMCGRGTRPSPETMKKNCLVLDFAKNTERLGPINDPVIPQPRGKGAPGVAPIRICDECGTYNHANARVCVYCGFEFPIHTKLERSAATTDLLRSDAPQLEWFRVDRVLYTKHFKKNDPTNPPSMKVTYVCGIRAFHEFIGLEHPNQFVNHKAKQWWRQRMKSDVAPPNVSEALHWAKNLQAPKQIQVWCNKRYPEILGYEWNKPFPITSQYLEL